MDIHEPGIPPWLLDARDFPRSSSLQKQLRYLIRYAILAPSTRNTQPWKFAVTDDTVYLFADTIHWQKVVDPDQRELTISLGCALENLLIAAKHFGFAREVHYFPDPLQPDLVVTVTLEPCREPEMFLDDWLFSAITARFTHHGVYEMRPLPQESLQMLQACILEEGITLHLTSDIEARRKVDSLLTKADAIELADPAYREELARLIGQGIYGTSWLLSVTGQLALSYLHLNSAIAKKDHEVLMSSPTLGLLGSIDNSRLTHLKVGRVFERFCLTAAALGIQVQPISQLAQVPEIRAEMAQLFPEPGLTLQQPFRLGYAPGNRHHSPRRSLEEVLV